MGAFYMGTGTLSILKRPKVKKGRVAKTASGSKLRKNRKRCRAFPRPVEQQYIGNVPELKISVKAK